MAPTNDITAPPTPTPPPAPSLADLYGPQGNLVAAPPTTPAGISQHQGAGGSWDEGSVPDESQRTQLENTGALPKARTTTQAASADIKKTGAVVQKVIDTPALKSVASQIPGYDEATSAAHESAAWLKAHGHEKAANALSAYLGAESGADEFASALTSPKNMMMLYSLGKLKTAGAGGEVLDRLISAKFSYDSIKDAYDSVPGVQKAIDGGDYETAARLITNAAGGFALGVSAAHGAVSGVNGGEAPEADTIRQRAADAQSTTPVAGRVDLTDLGDKPVETPAPEAGKVDLRSVSGKALDQRPAPEIKAEGPDWDRTHSAIIDGRKVGSVGMKVDPQGRAQIYGSVVNPDLRGQGIGQKLYKSAIEDAKAQGADRITSDSTNTSPDANRVWEKLRDSGEPVEEITHPNGKPGYQIDFTGGTPDLFTAERQSALKQPYPIEVQNPDGTTRVEKVDAYSSKDALAQARKKFPGAGEWQAINAPENRTPSTEYSVPKGKPLSIRDDGSGKLPEESFKHELGHNEIGQKEGLIQNGMKRHTHPDMPSGTRLGIDWQASDLFERGTTRLKADKVGPVIRTLLGGVSADEVYNDIPRAANHNFMEMDHPQGDGGQAYAFLRAAGFDHDAAIDYMHKAIDTNNVHLSQPEVSDTINENAGVREKGLSSQYHYSPERLNQIHAETQRRLGDVNRGNSEAGNGTGAENVARGKGEVAPANDQVSPTQEVKPYHPDLQAVADKYGTSDDAYKASHGASFIAPDGQFIHLSGTSHDTAIESTTNRLQFKLPSQDIRTGFMNDTGAIRTRASFGRNGHTLNISVPEKGVTPDQIDALKGAARATLGSGKSGNIVMETADGAKSAKHEFANANNIEPMLREIGAHPDKETPADTTPWNEKAAKLHEQKATILPERDENAYHPDLQKVADKYGVSDDPAGVKNGASFIAPDGKFIHLGTTEHPDAIRWAGAGSREDFLAQTGAVRVRFNARDKAGPTTHISVPPQGVTEAEIPAIRQAIAQAGRNGNVVMERSDITPETRDTLSMSQDFPRASDTEDYLRKIQAHPDQHLKTHEISKEDEGDSSFKFGANAESENEAAASAQRYNAAKGQPEINHEAPPVNDARAKALAAEMDTHSHEPNAPEVKKSYKSLIADVKEQWNHAQKDLGIKFEPSEKDPYDSYEDVKKDVEENKRMKIYTGGNPLPEDHPLSKVDPKTGLTYNTMLRGVHDLYGHIAGNNDFSEQGESGATNAHRQMMSPESVPALLNETEGQVSQYFHGKDKGNFPPQNATTVPEHFVQDWHETAGQMAAKDQAGGIDPKTGASDKKGIGTEIMPELRQPLDHAPTAEDFKSFYEQHKDIFDKYPEIRVGWDNKSNVPGGHEINVGAVGPEGVRVAKKLDQAGSFDIAKGEVIPTGGTGLRTEFPNYSIDERIKDLRGEPLSDVKNFEHLSKDFYDHMEPDERKYLEGNKTLQRNAMAQYHSITPSVNETTNAMQAGAALGGWWQRYIDTFHDLTGGKATQQIGPSHSEVLKQWHAAVSGNKSVQDANNLAWHSYADWLDAGKPTDRTSINNIVKQNAAQPEGSAKKGNAAISDTLTKSGKIKLEGLDTSKLFALVNSPEMRGERPFSNEAFNEETPNALVAKTEGARKIPSMGATVAGKGNLNRLVIDAHIRDFYGHKNSGGPAAQYIADSVHLRQAAEALGLKGGEGQEQLWGTVLGLKTLLKEGLTPADAAGKLDAGVINSVGKDYAEVIANDPEIKPLLARLYRDHGIKPGKSDGAGAPNQPTPSTGPAPEGQSGGGKTPIDQASLEKTAGRIREAISDSKIKKSATKPESKGWLAMMSKSGPNAK